MFSLSANSQQDFSEKLTVEKIFCESIHGDITPIIYESQKVYNLGNNNCSFYSSVIRDFLLNNSVLSKKKVIECSEFSPEYSTGAIGLQLKTSQVSVFITHMGYMYSNESKYILFNLKIYSFETSRSEKCRQTYILLKEENDRLIITSPHGNIKTWDDTFNYLSIDSLSELSHVDSLLILNSDSTESLLLDILVRPIVSKSDVYDCKSYTSSETFCISSCFESNLSTFHRTYYNNLKITADPYYIGYHLNSPAKGYDKPEDLLAAWMIANDNESRKILYDSLKSPVISLDESITRSDFNFYDKNYFNLLYIDDLSHITGKNQGAVVFEIVRSREKKEQGAIIFSYKDGICKIIDGKNAFKEQFDNIKIHISTNALLLSQLNKSRKDNENIQLAKLWLKGRHNAQGKLLIDKIYEYLQSDFSSKEQKKMILPETVFFNQNTYW